MSTSLNVCYCVNVTSLLISLFLLIDNRRQIYVPAETLQEECLGGRYTKSSNITEFYMSNCQLIAHNKNEKGVPLHYIILLDFCLLYIDAAAFCCRWLRVEIFTLLYFTWLSI